MSASVVLITGAATGTLTARTLTLRVRADTGVSMVLVTARSRS